MVIAVVPLVVAVIGILMWCLCTSPRLQEIGKWLFIIGTLWLVQSMATKQLHF